MGTQLPSPETGAEPQLSAHVRCGKTAGWIKMALGTEVGLGPGHIVLDGDPATLKRGHSLRQFSAHAYCGQTAVCISIPLGTEVGLGHRHTVLDGNPAPKGAQPPFLAHVRCGQTAGCIKMPLGMEVGLGPGDFVHLDRDPAPPSTNRVQIP